MPYLRRDDIKWLRKYDCYGEQGLHEQPNISENRN